MVSKKEERFKIPLISIALCTFNGERFLAEQLDSLLNQTYTNTEIVIVDDSSSDNTYGILKQYAKDNSNIRLFRNEENIGFKANFEKVLSLTKGDFIAFADQDDIWMKEKIEILLHKIGSNELIYHDSAFIDTNGNLTGKKISSHHRFVKGSCTKKLLYDNCISGHAVMISSSVIEKITPFPQLIYYDWWIAFVLSCFGAVTYTNDVLVHYRLHQNNVTRRDLYEAVNQEFILHTFLRNNFTPPGVKNLINELLEGYRQAKNEFSYTLFFLLLKNYATLFYVRKRSLFSRLKFLIRECKP